VNERYVVCTLLHPNDYTLPEVRVLQRFPDNVRPDLKIGLSKESKFLSDGYHAGIAAFRSSPGALGFILVAFDP
jgi:hypothetical protein